MLALFNFNTYLGGGETLFVRMAEFLQSEGRKFQLFYHSDSYIEKDLDRLGISLDYRCPISGDIDYYYLTKNEREVLLSIILGNIRVDEKYDLLTFCSRELYLVADLSKELENVKVSHLVLHNQDNLYACQSLLDKLIVKLGGNRQFSRKDMISFNSRLYNEVASKGAVIPMTEPAVGMWNRKYGIILNEEDVVPLPTSTFTDYDFHPKNNKKILWIGRIVDFKIPPMLVLLNFLKRNPDFSLSIVGYGEEATIRNYIKDNCIDPAQVTFLGKVEYSKLGEIINEHSIGYAMGTSIIEIAKYGLPVVMALANSNYKPFKSDICGDTFYHSNMGDVGVAYNLSGREEDFPLIDDVMHYIVENYDSEARKTYENVRENYDLEKGINKYLRLIEKRGVGGSIHTQIPYAGIVRRILFKLFSR